MTAPTITTVMQEVAASHGITVEMLLAPSTRERLVYARQEAAFLAVVKTGQPVAVIARHMKRSRTSVVRAIQRYETAPAPPRPATSAGPWKAAPEPSLAQVIGEVCARHGWSPQLIIAHDHCRPASRVRQEAMWECWQRTTKTLTTMQRVFKRDRTTIWSGIQAHERRLKSAELAASTEGTTA